MIKLFEKKTGRVLLFFGESKRINGKNTNRAVERIGYLDEFTGIYEDPIAHFKTEAKKRTIERKGTVELSLSEHFSFAHDYSKQVDTREGKKVVLSADLVVSYGMLPLSQISHE